MLTLCVLVFVSAAVVAFAGNSTLTLYSVQTVDENGEPLSEPIYSVAAINDGSSQAIDLTDQHLLSFSWNGDSGENVEGHLYTVVSSSTREYISDIPTGFADDTPLVAPVDLDVGDYELDIVLVPEEPPIVSRLPWWQNLLRHVIPTVLAQVSEDAEIIETVYFTITDVNAVSECCSSVLFLPGIKGSILKRDKFIGSDTLWPPTIWSNDVAQLALTADGESVHDVFVDGILETFDVLRFSTSVYDGFVSFMNGLVAEGTIVAWKPFAYDWRFALEDVLDDGVKIADDTLDLIEEVERLATESDTGQVTIVAHSMGGLLGKALIKKLEGEGKIGLIDAFIMVGSPQLGTPKAITALLHGDGEGIPSDLPAIAGILNNSVVDPSVARDISHNMPSSHVLLPSVRYFNEVVDPIMTFDTSVSSTENWRNIWGDSIDSYSSLSAFLTGAEDGRLAPSYDDLKSPTVLDDGILSDAQAFHAEYDSYVFPPHIRVVQVAGWGLPTIKGVKYTEEHGELDYRPLFTREGDGTVVYASAISSRGNMFYLDINSYEKQGHPQVEHKDLLNAPPVQNLLTSVIGEDSVAEIDFITSTKPTPADVSDQLLVSAHSPVILGVYDSKDNFTGIKDEQIVENIPGSSYQIFGQSQYVFLPKEGEYSFEYQGTGEGKTTIRVSGFSGDKENPISVYSDIETTEQTNAIFDIDTLEPKQAHISIDTDGDGVYEASVPPDGEVSESVYTTPGELLALLKTKVRVIDGRVARKLTQASIKKFERHIRKGRRSKSALMREGEMILYVIEKWEEEDKGGWWKKWW